jgi:hypothetical protein
MAMRRCTMAAAGAAGIGAAALLGTDACADAQVWATCGPFTGVSHIVQGVGVNNVQVGGQTAGLAGETTLVYDPALSDQPFDVVHRGDGDIRSLVAQGAEVVATEPATGGLVLAALYANGIVETFHFLGPTLIYTQSEHTTELVTTSSYVAECQWSR